MQPPQILPIARVIGQQSPSQSSQQQAQVDLVLLVNDARVAINERRWESLKELLERILEVTNGQPLLKNQFDEIEGLVIRLPDQFVEEKITFVCLIADYLSSQPRIHGLGRDRLGQPVRWECDLLLSMQWLQAAISFVKKVGKTDLLNLLYNQADRLFTRFVVLEVIEDELWMGVIEAAGNLIDRNCWRSDHNILNYIRNLKSYCHPEDFSRVIHRLLKHVIEKIPKKSSIESQFDLHRAEAAAIGQALVDERERIQVVKSCQENTAAFREDLVAIANEDDLSVRAKQMAIFNRYRRYFQETFVPHLQALLGPPPSPCRYHLVAMGSVGRGEITPLADLECFILMEEKTLTEEEKNRDNRRTLEGNYRRENEENRRYFKKMGRLLELLVLSVGEWFSTTIPSLDLQGESLMKGFHIDPTKGIEEEPWESNVLVATIDEAKALILKKGSSSYSEEEFNKYGNDKGGNCYSLLKSASLYSSDGSEELFQDYQQEIEHLLRSPLPEWESVKTCGKKIIRYTLQKRCGEFSRYQGNVLHGTVDLKEIVFRPFTLLLTDLQTSLCGNEDSVATFAKTNTLDLIDDLTPLFSYDSLELLKVLAEELHSLRINLHIYYGVTRGAIKDEASFDGASLTHYTLTPQQQIMIRTAHEIVLKPLNQLLSNTLHTPQNQTLINKLILFLKKQFDLSTDSQESVFGKQHQVISFIDLAIKKLTEELELIFLADESLTWDESLSSQDREKTQNYLKIAPKQLIQQISLISNSLAIIDASEQRHQDVYCLIAFSDQITKQRTIYWEALDWKEDKIQTQLASLQRRQHALISKLREAYIKGLSGYHQGRQIARVLSDIPDRQGMRISTHWAERRLSEQLALLTRDGVRKGNITCQVRRAGSKEEFFLNVDALTMIDSEGHLIHQYPHTHRGVFGYPKESPQLFFKAYPYQPMAEYADFSLKRRLGITSSPATELVRFDLQVNEKPLSYPVLISEAVSGIPLDQAIRENSFQLDKLDSATLTLMALCELLLSPGDGRAENKILTHDGSTLASIDNDIICVEPRVPSLFSRTLWGRRFYFCSILFCLGNVPLDPGILKRFAALNPSEILSGWIEDLRKKEQHYLSLFPNAKERTALYDSPNPNLSFNPTWVIQERTLLRIDTQFRYLQQRIRENSLETILNLLGCYVSLDRTDHREMIEGQRLEEAYTSVYSLKTANPIVRLEQALNFDSKTMTNLESQKASCQIKPDAKQIENGQFSLRRAEEIYRRHQLVDQFALARIEKGEISINFSPWKGNQSKQQQLLNYLLLRTQEEKCLPTSLTLIQCEVLTEALLLPFLHNDLKELNLAKCPLQLSSNLLLTQAPHLERLVLTDCSGLTTFEGNFSQLQELRLDRCENLSTIRIQAQIIHYFRADKTPNLKTLEIGNTLINRMIIDDQWKDDPFFENLSGLLLLKQLAFNDPSLTKIDLSGVRLNVECTTALALALENNNFLIQLNLNDCQVNDASTISLVKALRNNSSLIQLDLSNHGNRALDHNRIGNTGAASLAKALQHNTTLTTLNLNSNKIGTAGAISLAKALQYNATLTMLNLNRNHIGADGAASLAEALQYNSSLTTLNLTWNEIGTDGAASLAKALQHNSSLTNLNLINNKIDPDGASYLAEALQNNSFLTTLDLTWNKIGNAGITSLAKALQNNSFLKTLKLEGKNISDAAFVSLFKALQNNSSLKTLKLRKNNINANGDSFFATDSVSLLAESLKNNDTLTKLDLNHIAIGDAGTTSLAEALQNNNSLMKLKLVKSNIGADGIASLTKALQHNSSLTTLDLSWNKIGADGSISLAKALQNNSFLTKLDLSRNEISIAGTTSLAKALQHNSSLTKLDLRDNNIGDVGTTSLAEVLKHNRFLAELDLGWNNIGDDGAASLAKALRHNKFLTTLNLHDNHISDNGGTSLAEALKNNNTLTSLNLYYNDVKNAGTISFAQTIKINTTLTFLNVAYDLLTASSYIPLRWNPKQISKKLIFSPVFSATLIKAGLIRNKLLKLNTVHLKSPQQETQQTLSSSSTTIFSSSSQILATSSQASSSFEEVASPMSMERPSFCDSPSSQTASSSQQDDRFEGNALTRSEDSKYWYQATDLFCIQKVLFPKEVALLPPLGVDQLHQGTPFMQALSNGEWVAGCYNQGGDHWIAYAILKEMGTMIVLYKDSLGGGVEEGFNDFLTSLFASFQVELRWIQSDSSEQTDGASCGVFALQNLRIMTKELSQNKASFVERFARFEGFCVQHKADSLRRKNFPRAFVKGTVQLLQEEKMAEMKRMAIEEHHLEELLSLANQLNHLPYTITQVSRQTPFDRSESNKIGLEIGSSKEESSILYTYSYRINISQDLHLEEVQEHLQQIWPHCVANTEDGVIKIDPNFTNISLLPQLETFPPSPDLTDEELFDKLEATSPTLQEKVKTFWDQL